MKSDPVKRLFNQPNIIIKTIPLNGPLNSHTANTNGFADKKNGVNKDLHIPSQPNISIHAVKPGLSEKIEEGNFLPSKKEGKSEIALLPIKREKKNCGHIEPCVNIVCDVNVQQYVDHDGISPMLAVSIDDDEINAPVSKHCKNVQCDALSIDHNRCRRALIKLHRFDRQKNCDICGIMIQTNKSRVHHKNCKRKDVYRHNENDGAQVLREKMREIELQMIEAAKTKKNDYMDNSQAMEALQNNDELIIIPRSTAPQQSPIITITTVPSNQINQQFPNMRDVFGNFLPSIPIMFSQQNMITGKQPTTEDRTSPPPAKQPRVSENFNNTSGGNLSQMLQNPFIKVTGMPQGNFIPGNMQSMTINDWLMSQQVVTTPIQPKPFLTPIRVVPIANLKTQPSLLHQTQGIPRFCIMADTGIRAPTPAQTQQQPPSLVKFRTVQPAGGEIKVQSNSNQESALKSMKNKIWKKNARLRKKRAGTMFNCTYCPKRFSTDWYFKMHVARHRGEMLFSCKICEKPFSNKYDIKKHMAKDHVEGEVKCETCGHISPSEMELQKHLKARTKLLCEECKQMFNNCSGFNEHQKNHGAVVCIQCRVQVPKLRYKKHLLVQHGMSKTKADNECTKMKCPIDCDFANETGEKKSNGVKGVGNLERNDIKINQSGDQEEMRESNGIYSEDGEDQENDSDDEGALEINEDDFENEIDEEDVKPEITRTSFECPGCGEDFDTEEDLAEHNNVCLRAALKLCKCA